MAGGALDELFSMLDALGATPRFGLDAQGHVPTVLDMLARGDTWDAIGAAIGWTPSVAEDHWKQRCVQLGERWRACTHFRWMPGMLAMRAEGAVGGRVCRVDESVYIDGAWWDPDEVGPPDVADAGTRGCLLESFRLAWRDRTAHAVFIDGPEGWRATAHWTVVGKGRTEDVALIAGLEAATAVRSDS